jgi:hypothetical protein
VNYRIRPPDENDPIYVMNPPRLAVNVPVALIFLSCTVAMITLIISIIDYVYHLFFA